MLKERREEKTYAGQADSVRTLAVKLPASLNCSGFLDCAVWYVLTNLGVSYGIATKPKPHVSDSCKSFIMMSPDVNSSPISAHLATPHNDQMENNAPC